MDIFGGFLLWTVLKRITHRPSKYGNYLYNAIIFIYHCNQKGGFQMSKGAWIGTIIVIIAIGLGAGGMLYFNQQSQDRDLKE